VALGNVEEGGSHLRGLATTRVEVRRPEVARAHRWTAVASVSSLSTGREMMG
jgi:hypothetical protein